MGFDDLTNWLTNSWLSWNASECHHVVFFSNDYWLVVWNHGILFFHSVGNGIIPTVTHSMIFQRGRLKPPIRTADPWNAIMVWIRGFPYSWSMGPIAFVGLWMFIMENNGKYHLWMDENWGYPISGNHHFTNVLLRIVPWLWRGKYGELHGFFTIVLGKTFVYGFVFAIGKKDGTSVSVSRAKWSWEKTWELCFIGCVHGFLYGLPVCPTLFRQCSLGWQSSVVRKICDLGGFRLNIYHSDGRSTIVFLYHPEILKSKDTPNLGLSAKTVFVTTNSTKTR